MESSSTIYVSPSFDRHSSNNIADIADRVVQQLRAENGLNGDDEFSFSDEDSPAEIDDGKGQVNTNTHTEIVKRIEENDTEEDQPEFEFPVVCNPSPVEVVSNDHISPRYPLFDTRLLSEVDLNSGSDADIIIRESDSKPSLAPSTRPSLRKLFSEDRDSGSCSSSEADDLDGITPGTYCVWKPKTEPPRGKHKKSNSISVDILNTSKRWKVRDLLKRSYSDDNYSTTAGKDSPVVLFLPPISPKPKTNNERVKKIDKTDCAVGCGVGGGVVATAKTERKVPAYKSKIGNIRLPPYYPYRQDQVGMFAANFNGSSKNLYRY